MAYRLYVPSGGYVCKGSYVVQGERYKVLGDKQDAKIYKKKESAQNDWKKMMNRYSNIDYDIRIICDDTE